MTIDKNIVLKIGPNRPIQPVELGTKPIIGQIKPEIIGENQSRTGNQTLAWFFNRSSF